MNGVHFVDVMTAGLTTLALSVLPDETNDVITLLAVEELHLATTGNAAEEASSAADDVTRTRERTTHRGSSESALNAGAEAISDAAALLVHELLHDLLVHSLPLLREAELLDGRATTELGLSEALCCSSELARGLSEALKGLAPDLWCGLCDSVCDLIAGLTEDVLSGRIEAATTSAEAALCGGSESLLSLPLYRTSRSEEFRRDALSHVAEGLSTTREVLEEQPLCLAGSLTHALTRTAELLKGLLERAYSPLSASVSPEAGLPGESHILVSTESNHYVPPIGRESLISLKYALESVGHARNAPNVIAMTAAHAGTNLINNAAMPAAPTTQPNTLCVVPALSTSIGVIFNVDVSILADDVPVVTQCIT